MEGAYFSLKGLSASLAFNGFESTEEASKEGAASKAVPAAAALRRKFLREVSMVEELVFKVNRVGLRI